MRLPWRKCVRDPEAECGGSTSVIPARCRNPEDYKLPVWACKSTRCQDPGDYNLSVWACKSTRCRDAGDYNLINTAK